MQPHKPVILGSRKIQRDGKPYVEIGFRCGYEEDPAVAVTSISRLLDLLNGGIEYAVFSKDDKMVTARGVYPAPRAN